MIFYIDNTGLTIILASFNNNNCNLSWDIYEIWSALSILEVSVTFYECRSSGSRSISALATCCCPYKCECIFHFDSFSVVAFYCCHCCCCGFSSVVSRTNVHRFVNIIFNLSWFVAYCTLDEANQIPQVTQNASSPKWPHCGYFSFSPTVISALPRLLLLRLPSWKQVVTFPP